MQVSPPRLYLGGGERGSNTWVTYPRDGDNLGNWANPRWSPPEHVLGGVKGTRKGTALGRARGLSGSWWGNGPPSLRRVGGLRGWPPPGTLRHGSHSYGRQQPRILGNGGNPDPATPRAGRSPSGCKPLFCGSNPPRCISGGMRVPQE
jgi:hypothetical protein